MTDKNILTENKARAVVIIGITGDLARRMLIPSLYALYRDNLLPKDIKLVGASRSNLTTEAFRALVAESLMQFVAATDRVPVKMEGFCQSFEYAAVDSAKPETFAVLADILGNVKNSEVIYHLSTSPNLYGSICAALQSAGLAHDKARLLIEKPIGHDLTSSRAINAAAGAVFDEERIFRIDHYLGKESVQNLLALRFGNMLFEPLWNASHIEQVQITVAETVGVEGRWGYYDDAGALRDMVQNHMLQLLSLIAMEPPAGLDSSSVRNEKIKVLRSLRPIGSDNTAIDSVQGQYSAGSIGGTSVVSYADEEGSKASNTETFVALRAHIDNWRWAGVPFYLRTGKRLAERSTEIFIQFRSVPHSIFKAAGAGLSPNKMIIKMQPEESIQLYLMSKVPGLDRDGLKLKAVPLNLSFDHVFSKQPRRIAYERLFLDAINNNGTLFVHRDEIEAAWQWIDGIHNGWQQSGQPPHKYASGSWGPTSAIALTERHGHSWHE